VSARRLVVTTAAMVAVAVGLRALTPDLAAAVHGRGDLQSLVDTAGPEALLLTAVAALAWAVWAWGALGLALTALSALPGLAGAAASLVLRWIVPASGRRAAALALGIGLATAPALAGCATTAPPPAVVVTAAAETTGQAAKEVPDWPAVAPADAASADAAPADAAPALPDWPAPAPGDHVVLRGECLWAIAAADLHTRTGAEPTDAQVAAAVGRWWSANATVIGPDPDLLLPGQVLRPPP
jgi:nucleoid-associated protein YgaU